MNGPTYYDVYPQKETDKAILMDLTSAFNKGTGLSLVPRSFTMWIPKSQIIEYDKMTATLVTNTWFSNKIGQAMYNYLDRLQRETDAIAEFTCPTNAEYKTPPMPEKPSTRKLTKRGRFHSS